MPDPTTVSSSSPGDGSSLRRPSVACYLLGIFFAMNATTSLVTALGKQVFDLTGNELDLGLIGLVAFVPVAVLVIPAGNLADRVDRRRIATVGVAIESASAAVLAVIAANGSATLARILIVLGCFATARAVVNPAYRAMPADLVVREDLPRMSGLVSLALQSGMILGPVAGGVLYAVDPQWPFVFSAVGLGLSSIMFGCVRWLPGVDLNRHRGSRTWRDVLAGLPLIRRTPVLLGAITLDLFAVLFGGAVALLPVIAERRLGVGSVGYGWLRAATGIGSAAAGAVLAVRPLRRRIGPILFGSVAVFGLGTIVLGLTRSYVVAFVAVLVLSAADGVSMFIRSTITPLVVTDETRGRVLAVEAVFIGASNELGTFESGVAAWLIGAPAAIVLGGVGTLVVVIGSALGFPVLRRLDRFDELSPPQIAGLNAPASGSAGGGFGA